MPRKHDDALAPTHPCSGTWPDPETGFEVKCQNRVRTRRPSSTGEHWCSNKRCQSAKQRWVRARSKARERAGSDNEVLELVIDLVNGQRTDCDACGLENALVGWAHRNAPGSGTPCLALGAKGRALPPGVNDALVPERAPR